MHFTIPVVGTGKKIARLFLKQFVSVLLAVSVKSNMKIEMIEKQKEVNEKIAKIEW